MNKQSEQNTTSDHAADHNLGQKTVLNMRVSTSSKSAVKDDSRRIVHAFTLHARSNRETKEPPKTRLTNLIVCAPMTTNAPPQVRYKKSFAHSGFCQIGNTFDMAGQLG